MKSKLAISITVSGYIIFVAYVIYDSLEHGAQVFKHFFQSPEIYEVLFHTLIFLAPFISTALGYLISVAEGLIAEFISLQSKLFVT